MKNNEVSLEELLYAKEVRVENQKKFIKKYDCPVISFMLNIPGSVKDFLLSRINFEAGFNLLLDELGKKNIEVIHKNFAHEKTGSIGFISANASAFEIKKIAIDFEEKFSFGRIFDIDVINLDGNKISRADLNLDYRKCFLCEDISIMCTRKKKHKKEEVWNKVLELMKNNLFLEKFFRKVAISSVRALVYEVSISPKPGLVDRFGNGSHKDMNYFTFLDSAFCLEDYFYECVKAGFYFNEDSFENLFNVIRNLGIKADATMNKITNNVNTHKGLIFSFGVINAAYGYLVGNGKSSDIENICKVSSLMTKKVLEDDFKKLNESSAKTYGEKIFLKYGLSGVRGEAASGFPLVLTKSYPYLCKKINSGIDFNLACVKTLILIISELDDTNILHRHDLDTLKNIKLNAKNIKENFSLNEVNELDEHFTRNKISPGGSADNLAITILFYFLEAKEILKGLY